MKAAIHPSYNEIRVHCACGNAFVTRSTHKGDIGVEICAACHPFFTGKQKLMDTAGRIERFRRKYAKSDAGKPKPPPKSKFRAETRILESLPEREALLFELARVGTGALARPRRDSRPRLSKLSAARQLSVITATLGPRYSFARKRK